MTFGNLAQILLKFCLQLLYCVYENPYKSKLKISKKITFLSKKKSTFGARACGAVQMTRQPVPRATKRTETMMTESAMGAGWSVSQWPLVGHHPAISLLGDCPLCRVARMGTKPPPTRAVLGSRLRLLLWHKSSFFLCFSFLQVSYELTN